MQANTKLNPTTFLGGVPPRPNTGRETATDTNTAPRERIFDREVSIERNGEPAAR